MSISFTQQLTNEHGMIVSLLNEANQLGISTRAGQQKLAAARDILLMHLKKEDSALYPVIERAAVRDAQLRTLMKSFQDEMKGVSQAAVEFFTRYEHGGAGFAFTSEFSQLMASLSSRIRREELRLYPAYDSATAGGATPQP